MTQRISPSLAARVSMEKHGFHYTHALGQNFIWDEDALCAIIDRAGLKSGGNALEIGPGAGVMTALMADMGINVVAVELDRSLEGVLQDVLSSREHARVVFADALKTDLDALTKECFGDAPYGVIANLPYYITTDLIRKIIFLQNTPEHATVMVQREAAQRILSGPGDKAWCAVAALVRYRARAEVVMEAPRTLFTPPPHVDSSLIRLDMHRNPPVVPANEDVFLRLIDAAFFMRRKTLANNLTAVFKIAREDAAAVLSACELDARVRGEALDLPALCRVADALAGILRDKYRPLG